MRITQSIISSNAQDRINRNLSELYKTQDKIGSGKMFSASSDDPTGAAKALTLRTARDANQSYINAANEIELRLTTNEIALNEMTEVGTRLLRSTESALSDTMGASERITFKNEIRELVSQIVDIGNSTYGDDYIFNGYKVDSADLNHRPFEYDDALLDEPFPGPYTDPITPADSGDIIERRYGTGKSVIINISGEETVKPLLESAIRAYRALDAEEEGQVFDKDELLAAIDDINSAVLSVKAARTANGARQKQITDAITTMEKNDVNIRELLSEVEDSDLATLAVELASREVTYQTTLEMSKHVLQLPNLFDYIS